MVCAGLAFLVLSGIQYYLIKNTYNYKITTFEKDLRSRAFDFAPEYSYADSLQDLGLKKIQDYSDLYYDSKIQRADIIDSLLTLKNLDSLNNLLLSNFHKELENDELEYGVILREFILFDTITGDPDTILSVDAKMDNMIYGNLSSLEDAISISKGTTANNVSDRDRAFVVSSTSYVSLNKWKASVLKGMWQLILLAILILLFIIGLFMYILRAYDQQKKNNDIKTDFINNITHEFKTPLATLSIASKSLRLDKVRQNASMMDGTLDSIDRQNTRLQKLLDQVMSKSLGASELQLKKESFSVQSLLDNIVHDFKMSNKDRMVTIVKDYNIQDDIMVDKFYLTTALFNILENAVKYSKDNAEIKVQARKQKLDLIIQVSDNGIGINKNEVKTIFDKFYRVSTGNTHDVKGLGLGLFYTQNIVHAHNGTIKIESKIDKGTNVIIHLKDIFK